MKVNVNRLIMVVITGALLAPAKIFGDAANAKPSTGPTVENALMADDQLAAALRNNDSVGIYRMLDESWAVINTFGGVAEGPGVFPTGIRTGYRTISTLVLSEPRVRLYGDMALVTSKVRAAGMFAGKPFDVMMRQTDVLRWKDGRWKCVLTQESNAKE